MRGDELLDKMELIDAAYVEAAEEKPGRRRLSWVKWAGIAACLAVVVLAGAFLLRGREPAVKTVTVSVGGIDRVYKDVNVGVGGGPAGPAIDLASIEWPWEYKTTLERYTSLVLDGREYSSRSCTLTPSILDHSLLGARIGTADVTGGDAYSDEVHSLACEVYEIAGVSPELYVAVELDGNFHVFSQSLSVYDPPATLGELLDSCSLPQTLTLVHFTRHNGPDESVRYRQDDDAYLWSVLEGCRDAKFVEEEPRWMETIGEYLSFTAESEALGVHNLAFYVTRKGYIWTNTFGYAYMFEIGQEAAGQIIDYAETHYVESPWESLYDGLAGTVTGIEDGYLLIDDTILCADPKDGMVFRVPLDDVRISRHIDFGHVDVGDTVSVTFTGDIDVEAGNVVRGAFDLTECWIYEGEAVVPL